MIDKEACIPKASSELDVDPSTLTLNGGGTANGHANGNGQLGGGAMDVDEEL